MKTIVIETGERKEKGLTYIKNKIEIMFDRAIVMVELSKELSDSEVGNELAVQIIEVEELLNQEYQELILDITKFLIKEQPKAGDLRLILGVYVISSELETIGDYYKSFAKKMLKTELTERKHQKLVTNLLINTVDYLKETKEAFSTQSHELASSIARRSDEVDRNTSKLIEDINLLLVEADSYDEVKGLTRIISIAKIFDRTFNHLSIICEQISYIEKGQIFYYA